MALHVAARNGRSLGVVKAILSKEDPHFTYSANRIGKLSLLAIDNTRTDIVAELLNNPNSQSLQYDGRLYGETVLHKAVERWDIQAVHLLLEKQSTLAKDQDSGGGIALHYAANEGSSSTVATLLDKDKSIACIADVAKFTALHIAALQGFKHNNFLFSLLKDKKDILDVMKLNRKYKTKMARKREEIILRQLEEAIGSHLVASALVATVTFAAAFTLPGGCISDETNSEKGTPILSKNSAFKAFIISDTIAMTLSISSVFIYFIAVMLGYKTKYCWLIKTAFRFIFLARGAMVVAFVAGTYAVLAPSLGLAIATCHWFELLSLLVYIFIRLCCIPRYDDHDDGRILTL
ncbi:hypothetical protein GH714_002800 [Hevea brasiliensis]|uniref:PGG domain-containing protein n=1 Tax=Hevea brasiliensis TaxID=3981 RepID=A0A6A6M865_HEVBR|nr:hypothetical protein GH714_002800 [Hevea brasiliensis]